MSDKVLDMGNGFWNVRGTMRAAGVINVGTQYSLVRLESGKFIFLDSYTLEDDVRDEIMTITNDGEDVEAVLNVHPFHTLHCAQMAKDFPNATMYGSIRHHEQVPEVDWAKEFVESEAVTSRYPELEFSIPQGIYYIAPDDFMQARYWHIILPVSRYMLMILLSPHRVRCYKPSCRKLPLVRRLKKH